MTNLLLCVIAVASCCVVGQLAQLIQRMDESNRLLDEIADLLCIDHDDGDGGEPEDAPKPSAETTNVIPLLRKSA